MSSDQSAPTPEQEIGSVTADGAFDTRKNAKQWKPDTPGASARNEILRMSKRRADHLATMKRLPPSKPP